MATSTVTSPSTTPRWHGYEDGDERNPLTSIPELITYVESKRKTVPTSHTPEDSRWLFVAIYAIYPEDTFLMEFAKKFHELGTSVLKETNTLVAALETERNEYKALKVNAQAQLDEYSSCKPNESDLRATVTSLWNTYANRTKTSHRGEYQQKRAALQGRIEEAKHIKISEADKKYLHRRHYTNSFVTEGCLGGYNYQTYEARVLLKKIEGIWQERNEACAAFEAIWDRLKYGLEHRRDFSDSYFSRGLRKAAGSYVAKEPERDLREAEPPLRIATEEPPLEPYCWLDLAAEMWRLFGVKKRLQELMTKEGDHTAEIAKCREYEEFVMGQTEATNADWQLFDRASTLRDDMSDLHKKFTLLCESMAETETSIGSGNTAMLETIKTETIPTHLRTHHTHHETTRNTARTLIQIKEELENFASDDISPTTQLGTSLEVLGFTTAEQFQRECAEVTKQRGKAREWITSLTQKNTELEREKHNSRVWNDWLFETAERDFSPPWKLIFYGNRIIRGITYMDRISSGDGVEETS